MVNVRENMKGIKDDTSYTRGDVAQMKHSFEEGFQKLDQRFTQLEQNITQGSNSNQVASGEPTAGELF